MFSKWIWSGTVLHIRRYAHSNNIVFQLPLGGAIIWMKSSYMILIISGPLLYMEKVDDTGLISSELWTISCFLKNVHIYGLAPRPHPLSFVHGPNNSSCFKANFTLFRWMYEDMLIPEIWDAGFCQVMAKYYRFIQNSRCAGITQLTYG